MKVGLFEILPGHGGGNTYQKYIVQALYKHHEVTVFRADTHPVLGFRLGKIYHAARIFRSHPEIDLWISSYLPTIALSFARPKGKIISLFFHLDDSVHPNPILGWVLQGLFFRQTKKCDRIVVIAQYWRDFLERKGVKVTDVIYWGFDVSRFRFEQQETEQFKEKYNLEGKPIIYLGNCQQRKGVVDAYQRLKEFDAYLITSGEEQVKIPARNLSLSYEDYCLLLHASDVVLTLSKFQEGWNATAHEALLAGTPVIGSGKGGMAEVLEGGGQAICKDFSQLPDLVVHAIKHKMELGKKGQQFAKKFTVERFADAWLNLIQQLQN